MFYLNKDNNFFHRMITSIHLFYFLNFNLIQKNEIFYRLICFLISREFELFMKFN